VSVVLKYLIIEVDMLARDKVFIHQKIKKAYDKVG